MLTATPRRNPTSPHSYSSGSTEYHKVNSYPVCGGNNTKQEEDKRGPSYWFEKYAEPGSGPLEQSKLGLLEGVGGLVLVHGVDGSIVGGHGVWTPQGRELQYEDLTELLRPGVALLFMGPAWDQQASNQSPAWVTVEVEVASVEPADGVHSQPEEAPVVRLTVSPATSPETTATNGFTHLSTD